MIRPRRLLILYWDIGLGGVQKKIYDIVTKIYSGKQKGDKEKITILILLDHKNHQGLHEDLYYQKLKSLGAEIKYDPGWKWRSLKFPYILHALWLVFKARPDTLLSFLHRHGIISVIIKLVFFWRKIKVVYGQDIILSEALRAIYEKSNRVPRKWQLLVKTLFPFIDIIIAPTVSIKSDLIENFGLAKQKIKVIHNWVLDFTKRKITTTKYDLLYIGRISKQKRLDRLVDIVETLISGGLINIKIAIVGDGEEAGNLAYLILRHKLYNNIYLLGTSDKAINYFSTAKVFILTSDYEGEPIALLEAMAKGIPVVVSNYKGVKEVIRDGYDGIICKSNRQFSNKIRNLLTNKRLSQELGSNSIKTVKRKFTVSNLNKFTSLLLIDGF